MCRSRVRLDSIVRVQVDQPERGQRVAGATSVADDAAKTDEDEELVAKFGTKVQRVVRELNGRSSHVLLISWPLLCMPGWYAGYTTLTLTLTLTLGILSQT